MLHGMRGITGSQIKKLWVSAKSLGLGDVEVHQLVAELTGKTSIRTLTSEEGSRVIDRLVAAGADPSRFSPPTRGHRPALPPNIIVLATEKQIGMISRLLWHLGWGADDAEFRACVRQSIGRDSVRTKKEASHVINMLRDQMKRRGLEDQVAPSHRSGHSTMSGCAGVT